MAVQPACPMRGFQCKPRKNSLALGGVTDYLQTSVQETPTHTLVCSASLVPPSQPEQLSQAIHTAGKYLLATSLCCSAGPELGWDRRPKSWGTSSLVASWRRNNCCERFCAYKEQHLSGVWSSKNFAKRYVLNEHQNSLLMNHM